MVHDAWACLLNAALNVCRPSTLPICRVRRWCRLDLEAWFRSLRLTNRENPPEELVKGLGRLYCEGMQAVMASDVGKAQRGETGRAWNQGWRCLRMGGARSQGTCSKLCLAVVLTLAGAKTNLPNPFLQASILQT